MKCSAISLLFTVGLVCSVPSIPTDQEAAAPPVDRAGGVTLYDEDPSHVANRVHAALMTRRGPGGRLFGADRLDPLLWAYSDHLLKGPSHRAALAALDAFLAASPQLPPVKRAVLQHDLWAVFDWTVRGSSTPERRALRARLARAIRALALTRSEIDGLPNNLTSARKELGLPEAWSEKRPRDVFLPRLGSGVRHGDSTTPSDWTVIARRTHLPTAITHAEDFDARSVFVTLLRLPGGVKATRTWLDELVGRPYRTARRHATGLGFDADPDVPHPPAGTVAALVRRMVVIAEDGNPAVTPIVEQVQLRVFHPAARTGRFFLIHDERPNQVVHEFVLKKKELFAGRSGLRSIGFDHRDFNFVQFSSHGQDAFEGAEKPIVPPLVLDSCRFCHARPGLHSLLSIVGSRSRPTHLDPVPSAFVTEVDKSLAFKKRRVEWGLLQGLWEAR